MMVSVRASELWNYISPQLKDPVGHLARIAEIVATAAPETFDVLELKDDRVFERNSAIQLIKQRNVGRYWSFRDITQRKKGTGCTGQRKKSFGEKKCRFARLNPQTAFDLWSIGLKSNVGPKGIEGK
jgi:RecJ-like exonuclease